MIQKSTHQSHWHQWHARQANRWPLYCPQVPPNVSVLFFPGLTPSLRAKPPLWSSALQLWGFLKGLIHEINVKPSPSLESIALTETVGADGPMDWIKAKSVCFEENSRTVAVDQVFDITISTAFAWIPDNVHLFCWNKSWHSHLGKWSSQWSKMVFRWQNWKTINALSIEYFWNTFELAVQQYRWPKWWVTWRIKLSYMHNAIHMLRPL